MKIFTVECVSRKLKIDKQTVMTHIRKGKLQAHKVGRFWRIKETDLVNFLEGKNETATKTLE